MDEEREKLLREGFEGVVEEPDTQPAEEVIEETPVEPQQEEEKDPWEGVNPVLRQTIESLNQKIAVIDQLGGRLRKTEGHIGDLFNRVNKPVVEQAPSKEQIAAAAKDEEKMKALKEDWPEWAEALESVESRIAGKIPDVSKLREEIRGEIERDFGAKHAELSRTVEERVLAVKHKDWKELRVNPDFISWAKTAPADLQEKCNSPYAEDAIDVFDKYKEHVASLNKKAEKETSNRQRLERAVAPKTGGTKPPKSEDSMTPAELRTHLLRQGYKEG